MVPSSPLWMPLNAPALSLSSSLFCLLSDETRDTGSPPLWLEEQHLKIEFRARPRAPLIKMHEPRCRQPCFAFTSIWLTGRSESCSPGLAGLAARWAAVFRETGPTGCRRCRVFMGWAGGSGSPLTEPWSWAQGGWSRIQAEQQGSVGGCWKPSLCLSGLEWVRLGRSSFYFSGTEALQQFPERAGRSRFTVASTSSRSPDRNHFLHRSKLTKTKCKTTETEPGVFQTRKLGEEYCLLNNKYIFVGKNCKGIV